MMHRSHPLAVPGRLVAFLAAGLVALLGLSLGAAVPAVAEQTAASTTAVTLQGGGLSISAPVDAGNIGTESSSVGAVTISGQLGQVQVTDSRGAPAGSSWTATAVSTDFTQTSGPSIGAASVGYTAGSIARVGIATHTANDPTNLVVVSAVVTATAIEGDNTAAWNPTIHVAVGAGMAAGVYIGTLTHSVS